MHKGRLRFEILVAVQIHLATLKYYDWITFVKDFEILFCTLYYAQCLGYVISFVTLSGTFYLGHFMYKLLDTAG